MAALGWQRQSGCVGVWGGGRAVPGAGRRGADVSAEREHMLAGWGRGEGEVRGLMLVG